MLLPAPPPTLTLVQKHVKWLGFRQHLHPRIPSHSSGLTRSKNPVEHRDVNGYTAPGAQNSFREPLRQGRYEVTPVYLSASIAARLSPRPARAHSTLESWDGIAGRYDDAQEWRRCHAALELDPFPPGRNGKRRRAIEWSA